MNYYSVDRFEEDFAVLVDDNGENLVLKRSELPDGTKEGSVIKVENGKYFLDSDEENKRRKRILSLQNKLFKK